MCFFVVCFVSVCVSLRVCKISCCVVSGFGGFTFRPSLIARSSLAGFFRKLMSSCGSLWSSYRKSLGKALNASEAVIIVCRASVYDGISVRSLYAPGFLLRCVMSPVFLYFAMIRLTSHSSLCCWYFVRPFAFFVRPG